MRIPRTLCLLIAAIVSLATSARAKWIWIEGEKPTRTDVTRHPWWYDKVKRDQLSGGDLISNWSDKKPGLVEYSFSAGSAGQYEFWVRANPVEAGLSYRLNGGEWVAIDMSKEATGNVNIADDGKIDLRFLQWAKAGKVSLQKGDNTIAFRMDSKNNNHGMLDCFVFSGEPFTPRGTLKPNQLAAEARQVAEENKGWFAFSPPAEKFADTSGFDLRSLNEKVAGEGGFIAVKGSHFVHGRTGQLVRFWAVNGPSGNLKDRDNLRRCARLLAKYGVNMVRFHGGYFDQQGEVDLAKVKHGSDVVQAMKAEGIYTHFSIYFPLWLTPKANTPWLMGYDGKKHPFAALYFNKDFQKQYQSWWKALLLTPDENGKRLIDEPAVSSVEIINEDSYLFWTFAEGNIPDPQLQLLEKQFGDWAAKKHGSIKGAIQAWRGLKLKRDNVAEGRLAFRPLWNMFNEKHPRDKDTAAFLLESQMSFYNETCRFLRGLGFKGLITCSNWTTASPQVLGPLEKYSYTVGDFIDRHGYFECNHKGDNAAWSIRTGHTYSDRSALRFEGEQPGKPKLFVHPVMDPHYNGKPSMISETTFCRPNRYRSEAPLYYAAYGALQDSDCIVHFALDSASWAVKPGFFMQQWTIMSPSMAGQFPATAMIYRKGLVAVGDELAQINLKLADLLELKGTPLPQDAAFDELRLKDVPAGTEIKPGNVIDPLIHYAGRTSVNITDQGGQSKLADLAKFVDRSKQTITSTTGQVKLDYGKGILTINAPAAQGVGGNLRDAGDVQLKDVAITCDMDLAHIVAVSLDDKPLASSRRILLQVMTEEKGSNFQAQSIGGNNKRIVNIGQDPWLVKEIGGTVRFTRPDAARLKVTALDLAGYPAKPIGSAAQIKLEPQTMYYLVAE